MTEQTVSHIEKGKDTLSTSPSIEISLAQGAAMQEMNFGLAPEFKTLMDRGTSLSNDQPAR